MAERRRRIGRLLALVALLILVFLLFEMNRWLPGSWPGGGGDAGLRERDQGRTTDPTRVEPSKVPPVEPTPHPGSVRVTLHGPDGGELTGGGITAGSGQSFGSAFVHENNISHGWRVWHGKGRIVEHGQPPANATKEWVVQWPRAEPPPESPRRAREVVVTEEEGKPIDRAQVDVKFDREEKSLRTGPDGKVLLPRDSRIYRVCVTADGFGDKCLYAAEDQPGPIEVRLPRMLMQETRFVDPVTHEPLVAESVQVVHADGTVATLPAREKGHPGFHGRTPADQVVTDSLEVKVPGRPTVRVPLAGLAVETGVPQGKSLRVSVTDASGKRVANAAVEAMFATPGDKELGRGEAIRERTKTDAEGMATLTLPTDRVADVRVEAEGSAARGFYVNPSDDAQKDALLDGGVRVPVHVVGADGKPVRNARVVALGWAGSVAVQIAGTTDKGGLAYLPPLPAGDVEVYAHSAGFAWGSVRTKAAEGMAAVEVSIPPGGRLLLLVEDAYGVPISGVRVRRVPSGVEPAAAVPLTMPDTAAPDAIAWVTDDSGILDVQDVDMRPADLWLSKPGWQVEVVRAVTPGKITWFATLVRDR